MARKALIIVENLSVPFDRRVWQEATALREAGWHVDVVCPQGRRHDTESEAEIDGIRIHRYPLSPALGGPAGFLREYGAALWHSLRLARRVGPVDVVHLCNPPDLLFLVAPSVARTPGSSSTSTTWFPSSTFHDSAGARTCSTAASACWSG